MDELKEHWMREIEEEVTENMPPITHDNVEEDEENDADIVEYDNGIDLTTFATGANFDNPVSAYTYDASTNATVDMTFDPTVTFDSSAAYAANALDIPSFDCADLLLSQATGTSASALPYGGMLFDHNYIHGQQPALYEDLVGASMWQPQQ